MHPMSELPDADSASRDVTRRRLLGLLAGLGVGSALFQRAVAARAAEADGITPEMVAQAEWIAGIELSDDQRQSTLKSVVSVFRDVDALRKLPVLHQVPPAVYFHPAPGRPAAEFVRSGTVTLAASDVKRPVREEDLAFLSVAQLAQLLRTKQVSSEELTRLYLARLARYDGLLHAVVTLTEQLALKQARQADAEIAAGKYRGPLHGIPWGAKDLIAYPGYPTTWGAPQFAHQRIESKATVAARLDEAGAVLVAKLSLGALAQGDDWFGGMTRNPWHPKEGSSGSSAGSAAATAAGLVGFSLGSETLGSIISPSTRCGATGLRPTYGRVSRAGCMTLAWTMDKIGPICRTVEDCALVFGAIHGHDGLDPTAVDQPFQWPPEGHISRLTVGYIESDKGIDERPELKTLQGLGVKLKPIRLPADPPADAITLMLNVESAAVFDELITRGDTKGLNSWPRVWRAARFVPAIDYVRASRMRTVLMRQMEEVLKEVDLYVGGDDLDITNLTGHPQVAIPHGFTQRDGVEVPESLVFTGRLYGETELLAVAQAFQQAAGQHLRRPPLM